MKSRASGSEEAPRPRSSVVVTGRQKVDALVADLIDKPAFGIDAARPAAIRATGSFPRLRMTTGSWVSVTWSMRAARGYLPVPLDDDILAGVIQTWQYVMLGLHLGRQG